MDKVMDKNNLTAALILSCDRCERTRIADAKARKERDRLILKCLRQGRLSQSDIGRMAGVSESYVRRIRQAATLAGRL